MKTIKLPIITLSFLCLLGGTDLHAWDWPLEKPYIQKDFAGDYWGGFFPGLMISSQVQGATVKSMADGELVFVRQDANGRVKVPWLATTALVLDHDKGMRLVYSGMEEAPYQSWLRSGPSSKELMYREGQALGVLPSTDPGKKESDAARLLVTAYDILKGLVVNPVVLAPALPDQRRPIIHTVELQWEKDGPLESLPARTEAKGPTAVLYAYLRDYLQVPGNKDSAAGLPALVQVSLNGQTVFRMEKLGLWSRSGAMALVRTFGSGGEFSNFYLSEGRMKLANLTLKDGVNRLELMASDYAGNRSGSQYRITWKAPELPVLPASDPLAEP